MDEEERKAFVASLLSRAFDPPYVSPALLANQAAIEWKSLSSLDDFRIQRSIEAAEIACDFADVADPNHICCFVTRCEVLENLSRQNTHQSLPILDRLIESVRALLQMIDGLDTREHTQPVAQYFDILCRSFLHKNDLTNEVNDLNKALEYGYEGRRVLQESQETGASTQVFLKEYAVAVNRKYEWTHDWEGLDRVIEAE